ncbi:SusC/RagA family TonB-linked outer membrane protein [Niastella populi]|uniref:SusC/RagA family TonB-linked outer membrane protein n=1 Tax=Niastella populi TaxID=550983 RepID=A0A1V9FD87_9BACT|nr:TonB-dependent receptor [Niastella populi]OQP56146.1 SusC/RagA family TonB-linked outer membrane protein [Niastella populi]
MRAIYVLLFLICSAAVATAQTKTITGTVKDDKGEQVPGATVTGKGTQLGTTTNTEGAFQITLPQTVTSLVITHSTMQTREVALIDGQTNIDIILKASTTNLNEVVVIGYGTVKRKDLTGSVGSVSGKQLAAVPVANAAQALQGKIPGVSVTAQDGRPDAAMSVRVRGGSSISNSNEPLYIVDGFPVSNINDIPASQIESIDVLKDASSAAIYGARGANGVVIVTTKSGKNGKFTISYDNYLQYNKATKYLETMGAYDYIAYNWAYAKSISNAYASAWERLWGIGSFAAQYNNTEGIDHYKNVGATNYSKEAYSNSFSHNHNLSISNGNDKTRYMLTLSYLDNEGMKINSWFKRANALFKIDQKIARNLTFSFDGRYADIQKMGNEGTTNGKGSILSSSYQFRPIATSDVLGELDDRKNTQIGLYDRLLQDQYNPVELMKDYLPLSKERSLRANAALSWTIIKGLTARSEFGYNRFFNRGKTWSGAVYNNYLDADGNKTFGGNASISSSEGWGYRWVNTLTYNVTGLGEAHSLNVVVGQEVMNNHNEATTMTGNKYPAGFDADQAFAMIDRYLPMTGSIVNFGISSSVSFPNKYNSYFGRANYTLLDKYLFTFTMRADGSSRFAPTKQWAYFPAAAFAWRTSDEEFMKDITWLNNLKLRASFGTVGNDGISPNEWRQQWSSTGLTQWSINEIRQIGYTTSGNLANPNLVWETATTRNLGIDFGIFQNRIYGTIDLYKNTTKDVLLLSTLNPISGFGTGIENVGSISNRGIELSLGGDIVNAKDFKLSASMNINFNRSKIEQLAPGVTGLYKSQWGSTVTQPNTGDYILKVGSPVGQVRGYVYDGWYTTDDFTYANGVYTLNKSADNPDIGAGIVGTVFGTTTNKPGGQVAHPGVVKFKDLTGDGIVNEKDVTTIGDMTPKHTGGFNVNASYKNFDLALNWNWSYGNQIYNANYLAAFTGSKEDGLYRNRLNYLSTSYKLYDIQNGQLVRVTDPAALKALNANATTFLPFQENPVVSSLGIQDGSFLRLNTVTIGYTLPASLISKIKLSRIRIYGAIYNALTLTSYPGLDPEVNTNTSQGNAAYPTLGLDWGSYPRARSFTAGVNIEF